MASNVQVLQFVTPSVIIDEYQGSQPSHIKAAPTRSSNFMTVRPVSSSEGDKKAAVRCGSDGIGDTLTDEGGFIFISGRRCSTHILCRNSRCMEELIK